MTIAIRDSPKRDPTILPLQPHKEEPWIPATALATWLGQKVDERQTKSRGRTALADSRRQKKVDETAKKKATSERLWALPAMAACLDRWTE